jgi:large subunit ribosomal protein L29
LALLKTKDIRAMRPEDIRLKFKELSDELMHERGIAAMGGAPASPGKLRALRTNVARIHTVMREMELANGRKKTEAKAPAKKGEAKESADKAQTKSKPVREKAKKRAAAKTEAKNEEEKK